MGKKFELTDKFIINVFGIKLFQIKCTKSFKYAQKVIWEDMLRKKGT